ncbi:NSP1, partial [Rotavirus G28]
RTTKLNRELLKIGANSVWTPVSRTSVKGWCIECCQLTELTFCNGCSLLHVCQWCVQNRRCFLDNTPHLLKLRTFESPMTKEKLQCVIDMYASLFPINSNVINKFKKMTKQRRCRNELNELWYNQLLLPITLNALTFKFQSREVHVFGFYEGDIRMDNLPYRKSNFIDVYDRLLLDQINFERMNELPFSLQSIYAQKYFKISRLPMMKLKDINYSDFTSLNLITKYRIKNRIITRNVSDFNWESELKLHDDLHNDKHKILAALFTSTMEEFEIHDLNIGRVKSDIFKLGHYCKPNYIASEHWQSASKVIKCEWCDTKYAFRNIDWRMESMYNELMSFIQSCYKSNTNVGHCSSVEKIYPLVKRLFWHAITDYIDNTIDELFNSMNPSIVRDESVITFHWQISITLYIHLKSILKVDALPFILSLSQFRTIIKGIVSHWCDISKLDMLPLCVKQTDDIIDLKSQGKLLEEYEL